MLFSTLGFNTHLFPQYPLQKYNNCDCRRLVHATAPDGNRLKFRSLLCHLLTQGTWARPAPFLSLSFPICKQRLCRPTTPCGCWEDPRKHEARRPARAEDRVPAVGTALLAVVLLRKHSSQQGKPGLRGDASCYSRREAPGRWGICALLGVGSQTICAQGVPGRML